MRLLTPWLSFPVTSGNSSEAQETDVTVCLKFLADIYRHQLLAVDEWGVASMMKAVVGIIWECSHMLWSHILIHVSFGFDGNDI
jgi:hypothetical protein